MKSITAAGRNDCGVSKFKSSNYTKMLMQAQDQRNLVNNIITMKSDLNNGKPQRYLHLERGLRIQETERQRVIDIDNGKMLSRIMAVMSRASPRSNVFGSKSSSIVNPGTSRSRMVFTSGSPARTSTAPYTKRTVFAP